MPIGLKKALDWHESNIGGFPQVRLPKSGDKVRVRILAGEPKYDPDTNEPIIVKGKRYIGSVFMHTKWAGAKMLVNERCLSDTAAADPQNCDLCRVNAPRTDKVILPCRERGDKVRDRVKYYVAGRDTIQTLASVIEEIPEGDPTKIDIVIKRNGTGTNTKYEFYPKADTFGEMEDELKALEFLDAEELIPKKDKDEIERIAMEYERSTSATKTGASEEDEDEDLEKVPF